MGDETPNVNLITSILNILKKYSDEEHKLSQEEIRKKLEIEYLITVDRKTISRYLQKMFYSDYGLKCTEVLRGSTNIDAEPIRTDWYLTRDFTDAELRLLIDSLLFSKHIPYNQCKELIGKLEGLSNSYFKAKVRHICNLPENRPANKQLFYTIETLDEAISKGKKVSFHFTYYQTDKKRHVVKNKDGRTRIYKVSPYQMVATNGRYYLICNHEDYGDAANYRVDYIEGIEILDEPVKPMEKVSGLENRLNLPSYMAEHVYMFSGESVPVSFKAKKGIVDAIIDWFGVDVRFSDETDDEVVAHVRVNERAMFYWAMQYGQSVEVLKPAGLRENIHDAAIAICDKYKN